MRGSERDNLIVELRKLVREAGYSLAIAKEGNERGCDYSRKVEMYSMTTNLLRKYDVYADDFISSTYNGYRKEAQELQMQIQETLDQIQKDTQ